MTTATNAINAGAQGFSFIRRGNSVTIADRGVSTLGERLREGYEGAAVYKPYEESIAELFDVVVGALVSDELSAESKNRLYSAMQYAEDFLTNRPWDVKAPTLEVWDRGEVAFEWYLTTDRIVTASIDELGRLAFAGMVGGERGTGLRIIDGQWPKELIGWIKKVTAE